MTCAEAISPENNEKFLFFWQYDFSFSFFECKKQFFSLQRNKKTPLFTQSDLIESCHNLSPQRLNQFRLRF